MLHFFRHTVYKHFHFVVLCLLYLIFSSVAGNAEEQSALLDYIQISEGFIWSSGDNIPFWMWANQNGRVSMEKSSVFGRLKTGKKRKNSDSPVVFYGLDATLNHDPGNNIILTDAYAGISYGGLQLHAGKKAEFFGLADTLLTAGPVVYSRNAPTIPKIALSTDGYIELNDWLAFNAYLAHGWFGDENYVKDAYLHQKFLYLRYGDTNPDSGFNIFAGMHDLAVWGGRNRVTGEQYPSSFSDFWRVFWWQTQSGGSHGTEQNTIGDHRGSIEYMLQLKGKQHDWLIYASTLFEDQSGLNLLRWNDYFAGVSYINKGTSGVLKRVNVEYFDTRNQGPNPSEPDNYFNNYMYLSGWTYEGFGIGHPFIRFTAGDNYQYTAQNKIRAINTGALFHFSRIFNPYVRLAYIENYGYINDLLLPEERIKTFSFDIINTSFLSNGWILKQEFGFDTGKNAHESIGGALTISKKIF
ncbi:MAG: capsule assembly Wzi family protein [Chlorobium sp.]|nr:MAG: capsule assembly Wzi family protein [Chlorobium sp.]